MGTGSELQAFCLNRALSSPSHHHPPPPPPQRQTNRTNASLYNTPPPPLFPILHAQRRPCCHDSSSLRPLRGAHSRRRTRRLAWSALPHPSHRCCRRQEEDMRRLRVGARRSRERTGRGPRGRRGLTRCAAERDLVIIGGGVAGYVAAIKAGQEGLKVWHGIAATPPPPPRTRP